MAGGTGSEGPGAAQVGGCLGGWPPALGTRVASSNPCLAPNSEKFLGYLAAGGDAGEWEQREGLLLEAVGLW